MALSLVRADDPVLHEAANEVGIGQDVRGLATAMLELMMRRGGVGLAAPQVGEPLRLIVGCHVSKAESWNFVLINPRIVRHDRHRIWSVEQCLSLPNQVARVRRWKRVIVEGYNSQWEPVRIKAHGLLNRVLQHEIEHLDGVLMTDPHN